MIYIHLLKSYMCCLYKFCIFAQLFGLSYPFSSLELTGTALNFSLFRCFLKIQLCVSHVSEDSSKNSLGHITFSQSQLS